MHVHQRFFFGSRFKKNTLVGWCYWDVPCSQKVTLQWFYRLRFLQTILEQGHKKLNRTVAHRVVVVDPQWVKTDSFKSAWDFGVRCFVLLTWGQGKLELMPLAALGPFFLSFGPSKSPELLRCSYVYCMINFIAHVTRWESKDQISRKSLKTCHFTACFTSLCFQSHEPFIFYVTMM